MCVCLLAVDGMNILMYALHTLSHSECMSDGITWIDTGVAVAKSTIRGLPLCAPRGLWGAILTAAMPPLPSDFIGAEPLTAR